MKRPVDFDKHCDLIGDLIEQVPDLEQRRMLYWAVEELVYGLSHQWIGKQVTWVVIPSDLASLDWNEGQD